MNKSDLQNVKPQQSFQKFEEEPMAQSQHVYMSAFPGANDGWKEPVFEKKSTWGSFDRDQTLFQAQKPEPIPVFKPNIMSAPSQPIATGVQQKQPEVKEVKETYLCVMCPSNLKRYQLTEDHLVNHMLAYHFMTDQRIMQVCPICMRKRKDQTKHQNLVVHFYDEH